MKRIIAFALTLLLLASTAQAAITYTGTGFYPSIPLPAAGGILGAGGDATLTVDDTSTATWTTLRLGWHTGTTGTLQIEDAGSGVTVNSLLCGNEEVSHAATGVLQITDGSLTVTGNTQLATASQSDDTFTMTANNAAIDTQLVQLGLTGTASATLTNGTVWNSAGDRFIVANSTGSNGSLAVTDSTINLTPTTGYIFANAAGSTATLTMDNGTINYSDDTTGYVGHIGSATVTMSNGSVFDSTGNPSDPASSTFGCWGASDCFATLSDSSQWIVGNNFYIANGNKASTVLVQGGSSISVGSDISIGDGTRNADSNARGVESHAPADQLHATVVVTGSGSSMSAGDGLQLGGSPDSHSYPHSIETVRLDIDSSATVSVGGYTVVGQGTADVSATLDFNGGTLTTGSLGANMSDITGTGTINTKGLVANGAMSIASIGDLTQTLSNGGSVTINLDIDGTGAIGAGYDGSGSLTISGGTTVTSMGGMLGYCMGASGTATVAGGGTVWESAEGLSVGGMGAGTLVIKDGAMVKTDLLVIDGDVLMDDLGQLDDYYYYVGYTGFYSGDPSDRFDISTDSLVQISNGGKLALPGNLTIGMNASDVLTAILGSDEIEIMDTSGAWVDLSSAVRNTDYTLVYDSGTGYTILTASPQIWTAGDANKDGKVDSSDLGLLANDWQAGVPGGDPAYVTWGKGDFNGDYKVDSSDLGLLANHWQFGVDMGDPSVVPEPSMLILLLGALLAGWVLRKK